MTFLLKYIGVQTGIVFMLMISLAQCVFMLSWTPVPNESTLIFMMAVGFALSMSVSIGQIRGINMDQIKPTRTGSITNLVHLKLSKPKKVFMEFTTQKIRPHFRLLHSAKRSDF